MKEARKLAGGGVRLAMPHASPEETPSAAPSAKPRRRPRRSRPRNVEAAQGRIVELSPGETIETRSKGGLVERVVVPAPFEVARVYVFWPSSLGRLRYALARNAKLAVSLDGDTLVITEALK